jgi:hypothetical protein
MRDATFSDGPLFVFSDAPDPTPETDSTGRLIVSDDSNDDDDPPAGALVPAR